MTRIAVLAPADRDVDESRGARAALRLDQARRVLLASTAALERAKAELNDAYVEARRLGAE